MFNINKDNEVKTSELKENANDLMNTAQESFTEISGDVKQATSKLQDKAQSKIKETKEDAMTLVNNLKTLLSENTTANKINEAKDHALDKAVEWKGIVQDEVARAIEATNAQTKKVVTEKPLLSLAVALAAGVLLGYVLGNKQSSNN